MNRKYEFTGKTIEHDGATHRQIRRISDGRIGGWIESEANLNHEGDCWVSCDAQVSGDAQVYGDALVSGNAHVSGDAQVHGNALVYGNAEVYGNAWACGNAEVYDNAQVYGHAEVYGNAHVSGNAEVYGDAQVYGDAHVSGNAEVYGDAQVSDSKPETTSQPPSDDTPERAAIVQPTDEQILALIKLIDGYHGDTVSNRKQSHIQDEIVAIKEWIEDIKQNSTT